MSECRAIVLRAPGTNCEAETLRALELAGARAELRSSEALARDPRLLEGCGVLVLAGGFSYGDDVAAGRIWGHQVRTRLRKPLAEHVARGGYVLGVCNGFQVLVEAGLFEPERGPGERRIALTSNASNHYECRWATLEVQPSACTWLTPGARFPVPLAHAEGRFVARDEATLAELRERGQVVLAYVRAGGGEPEYPENPNGSMGHVAGICDPTGRVLGLMPHPERNLDPWQHPLWTRMGRRAEGEGLDFYRRLVAAAQVALV